MSSKRVLILGTLVIFAMIMAACSSVTSTPEPTEAPDEGGADEAEAALEESSVFVGDQDVSAGTVMIEDVHAAQAGWIVIHTSKGGAPGPVIGFAPVQAGENHDVQVDIDLEQATKQLFAMLHIDAGVAGEYEFPGEDVPAKSGEAIVNVPFEAAFPIEPEVIVSNQDASGGEVSISRVSSADTGWLVIHAARNGGPGPVIGFAQVEAGNNSDLSVEIELGKATRQLYAMLHIDAGILGEYEFPGDDGPARNGESIVISPFTAEFPIEVGVNVSDQDFSDGIVTLDNVAAEDSSWLVIHIENDGAPGPVIGFAPVAAGNNAELKVEIDSELATPKLFAMLHLDAGTLGEYEFPGEDVPVRNGDDVVVVPFNLAEDKSMSPSAEAKVMVVDSQFIEKEITVSVGTTVIWKMDASLPHTVTADDGSFDSGTLRDGDTFSYTFEAAGTFPYYCQFHGGPGGSGMAGTVTVTN